MVEFWNGLTLFQQILMAIVAPATVILLLQFILLLFGLGSIGGDSDTDVDMDTADGVESDIGDEADLSGVTDGAESDSEDGQDENDLGIFGGLKLFTLRGILAFIAIGGWTALLVSLTNYVFWALAAGLLAGALADIVYGLMLKSMSKLEENGNIDIRDAIGKSGEVYIPVPAGRKGSGKVYIELSHRICELDAQTDNPETLKTGSMVTVSGIEKGFLLVQPDKVNETK